MRLDKYLSYALNLTRSEIAIFMKKNDIKVNGVKINKKDYKIDENKDEVVVNGNIITYHRYVYYMLNKPIGLVCSKKGFGNNTIYDLFEDSKYDLSSIGRLDKDTSGLLIITNDGALNHFITSPNNHIDKTYIVNIDDSLSDEEILEFKEGIEINDGDMKKYTTLPCDIKEIDNKKYEVTIHEGKFHQIKRMFAYFKKNVLELKRIKMGDIVLDTNLKEGEYRPLAVDELDYLKSLMK